MSTETAQPQALPETPEDQQQHFAEPYSLRYDERSSDACERYQQMVSNAAGPWTNMISNRPAWRSKINDNADRVVYTRPEAWTLVEDPQLIALLKQEGLAGNDSNIARVENDRPRVFSFRNESTIDENGAAQWIRQMGLFH